MKANEIDEQLLLKLYNEDLLSIVKCAEILKVSESCVRRRLRKLKIIIRTPAEQNTHQDVTNEQVTFLYKQGLSISETAKQLNKSEQFVRARLKKDGTETRSLSESIRKRYGTDNITDEEIINLYENEKMSTYEISKHFNKSPAFAIKRLSAIDHKRRKNIGEFNGSWEGGISRQIDVSEHQKICYLYLNDKTQTCKKIAEQYGVSALIVIEILKENGVVPSRFGSRNSSWKGGITSLHLKIRDCDKNHIWKRLCRERDGYKCRISGATNNLHVHHYPLTFSEIFTNFLNEYPNLNPSDNYEELFKLSQNYEPFWNIDNGMTVSSETHQKLHMSDARKDSERVIQLYLDGISIKEIANVYDVSKETIRNILNAKSS